MHTRCTPRICSLHPYDYLLWFMRLVALLYLAAEVLRLVRVRARARVSGRVRVRVS